MILPSGAALKKKQPPAVGEIKPQKSSLLEVHHATHVTIDTTNYLAIN